MALVYLFTDADGDYLFSQAPELVPGVAVMAVYKKATDRAESPEAFLDSLNPLQTLSAMQEVACDPASVGDIFTFVRAFESDSLLGKLSLEHVK